MTTHQEIPTVQADAVASIGEPPPPPTAASGGAARPHYLSEDNCILINSLLRGLLIISFIIFLCVSVLTTVQVIKEPKQSFKVESMSVTLDEGDISNNRSAAIRAAWDVGFSIRTPGTEVGVSVRCMSSNWSGNIIEGARNTASVDTVVIITLLPREFVLPELMVRGLTLQYDVLFRTDHRGYMVEGVCKNMTVAILPNATQGIMVGGKRSCHVHRW